MATQDYLDRHHVRCPSCGADFVAEGETPMATNCPVCGVTGFIRKRDVEE